MSIMHSHVTELLGLCAYSPGHFRAATLQVFLAAIRDVLREVPSQERENLFQAVRQNIDRHAYSDSTHVQLATLAHRLLKQLEPDVPSIPSEYVPPIYEC